MPKLSDLGLTNEQVGQALDYDTMPDQMGGFTEPPQPGMYRFRFPARMDDIWEVFEHANGNPPGKRIRAKFDDTHPLTIIQSPGETKNGEPFTTNITNAERRRGKKDDAAAPFISDMDYINRDVWGLKSKPAGGNVGYAQEAQKHASTEMTATVTWNWYCNPKRNIYVDNGQGGYMEVQQPGCDTSYYQKDVDKVLSNPEDPKSPQIYPFRITCKCGAVVRAFANLEQFKA
jgi:hypothetical protein